MTYTAGDERMLRRISFKLATHTLLTILGLVLLFHLLVLAGVIPYDIVWGGRLQNSAQMRGLELISLAANLTIMLVIGIKAGYVHSRLPPRVVNLLLWAFAVLFALNTVGNLVAEQTLETLLFTPATFLSAILCARIAMERSN